MKPSNLLILFTCILTMQTTRSHIIVRRKYTDQLIDEFFDLPASFGGSVSGTGLRVYPLEAYPDDGCAKQPTPAEQLPTEDTTNKKFVLIIARNNCTFEEKIRNAQNAKYDAAIVYNVGSEDMEHMSAKNSSGITIPSVFVGENTGRCIIDYYINQNEYVLIINDALPFDFNKNLILPFAILFGSCFFTMIFYMIYRCIRERRRTNHNRLPKRLLKKIPVIKFRDGLPYEKCVICLEDYTKGERLRVLACTHAYHCHCIDIWLTKNRRVCPICKRKVFVKFENVIRRMQTYSDSTTDSDEDAQPLLSTRANNHGTFSDSVHTDNNDIRVSLSNESDAEQPTTEDETNAVGHQDVTVSTNQRQNPFNRNDQISDEQSILANATERRGFFDFFKFRFLRRSDSITTPLFNEADLNADMDNNVSTHSVNVPVPLHSSNNILNENLSGSFQDSRAKFKSKHSSSLTNENVLASTSQGPTSSRSPRSRVTRPNDDSDIFIQTPSRGGIGVAALPNTSLNRDENLDRRTSQHRSFSLI